RFALAKPPPPPVPPIVDGAGDQLLSGPGLAEDEDGRIRRRHHLDLPQDMTQRRALADDMLESVLRRNLRSSLAPPGAGGGLLNASDGCVRRAPEMIRQSRCVHGFLRSHYFRVLG